MLSILLAANAWGATSIELTQAQIDKVVSENAPVCEDPSAPPPVIPPVAPPVAPPPAHCSGTALTGVTVNWKDYWGVAFPNPVSSQEFTNVPRNGYLAIKFNTANYVDTGLISTIESIETSGRRLGSISTCPGDFNVADKCKRVWGTGGDIFWSTKGYSKACILEPNTTYYFNLTFTDGSDPASTECHSARCITKIRAYNPR